MADWYVSSVAYAAVPIWVANTVYSVGQFVRQTTTPTFGREYVYRCTTAGTSGATEPAWTASYADNNTRTDGTVTWTNHSSRSAYGWSAASGSLASISNAYSNRPAIGDRIFISSDHVESYGSVLTLSFAGTNWGLIQVISVNRAGSVPPVAVDVQPGASISVGGNWILEAYQNIYYEGVSFNLTGGASSFELRFNSIGAKTLYFKKCAFAITNTGSASHYAANAHTKLVFDTCTVQFGATSQYFTTPQYHFEMTWLKTDIVGATVPAVLFHTQGSQSEVLVTCRGCDLSLVTGTLTDNSSSAPTKILLDSCKVAAAVTRLSSNSNTSGDEVELVNCFDGTSVINERYTPAGVLTTDRNTYLNSGAQDDVGNYSLKLVSSTRSDKLVFALDCFAFDVENTLIGSSKTATVEIISSGLLNDDDISLLLEYMGTSGNSVANFVSSLPATVLTAASVLASSSVTWNSPPATPQKQKLQVTFTPQRAGRVRGLVRLGKPSTTVWVNPQIAIA